MPLARGARAQGAAPAGQRRSADHRRQCLPQIAHQIGAHASGAMDISAACGGFCHALALALALAEALVRSGGSRYVIVAGSERMTDIV
jgi:3-oxoacyl-[acyl-carrier-protein] synthase-3